MTSLYESFLHATQDTIIAAQRRCNHGERYGHVTRNQRALISARWEQVMHHVPIMLCHFPAARGNHA